MQAILYFDHSGYHGFWGDWINGTIFPKQRKFGYRLESQTLPRRMPEQVMTSPAVIAVRPDFSCTPFEKGLEC